MTDPERPLEQSTLVLGRSQTQSEALWDPHALSWYSPATALDGLPSGGIDGTFAVPVRSDAWSWPTVERENAVRLVSVRPSAGAAALSLNGSISLTDLGSGNVDDGTGLYGWRDTDARRAVFVDSTAYAIADGAIRSAPITTPADTIQTLRLP